MAEFELLDGTLIYAALLYNHVTDVNCLKVLGIRGDWQNDLFSLKTLTNKLAEHTKFSAYFLLSLVYQKHCNFASKTYTLVTFTNATKRYVLEAKLQCFFLMCSTLIHVTEGGAMM